MKKYDIKSRRLELGLTLEEVGSMVGVSKGTVRKWETGYIKDMRRDKIELLAKALKISPSEFMGWDEPGRILEGGTVPPELRELGVDWIKLSKKCADEGLTPEALCQLIDDIKKFKGI